MFLILSVAWKLYILYTRAMRRVAAVVDILVSCIEDRKSKAAAAVQINLNGFVAPTTKRLPLNDSILTVPETDLRRGFLARFCQQAR